MQQPRLYETLLRLDYDDVLRSCDVNSETRAICQDPVFWEDKAQKDFKTSLRQVESERVLTPQQKYLAILSEKDVTRGSEEFTDPLICLRRAVEKKRSDLADYFVMEGAVDVDTAIIEATHDKELFDELVTRYNVDIYADEELLYLVLLEAIRNKNFALVHEIVPEASNIVYDERDVDELLNAAAATENYEFIDYIHDFFHIDHPANEDVDEWLLQAALLKGDEVFAEDLITKMTERDQYEAMAGAFVRAGDYERIENLIRDAHFAGLEFIGEDILLDAVQYNRPDIVRLITEDPVFQLERRRFWFEQALDLARVEGNIEITTYLTDVVRLM